VATIDMGRKQGGVVPLSRGERRAGSPSNTMWLGPKSTSVPSGVFIHPAFGHNRHGPKTGVVSILGGRELRSHPTQRRLGRGLPRYQVA